MYCLIVLMQITFHRNVSPDAKNLIQQLLKKVNMSDLTHVIATIKTAFYIFYIGPSL